MFNSLESITTDQTKDKIIFLDIDGTLAPYRFNGHVGAPNGSNCGMSDEEIEMGIFLMRKPSKHMQNVIKTSLAKEYIIISNCHAKKEIEDKDKWLDKYYPTIEKRLYPEESDSKADMIVKYCQEYNYKLEDVLYVDDIVEYLRDAERKGIESWHISSFLDWNYQ